MSELVSVAVFARNEERGIRRAIEAVLASPPEGRFRVFVLINGSRDRTEEIVRDVSRRHRVVVPVPLPFGDKAHAWNTYVSTAGLEGDLHFFTDGDSWAHPGSLRGMQAALRDRPEATAVAGLPLSGRHRTEYAHYITRHHWVIGGLYGVRASHLRRLCEAGLRLPVGLLGNDHWIKHLLWAGGPHLASARPQQVIHAEGCGYCFHPLQPYRLADWRVFTGRLVRNRLRRHQIARLEGTPVSRLPVTMDQVNQSILRDLERQSGPTHPLDWLVRRRLRREYPTEDARPYEFRLHAAPHGEVVPCAT